MNTFDKANLAVVKAASKDRLRYMLTGVRFEPGRTVRMHFAQDLSGEDQPPFSGWFRHLEQGCYSEVTPVAWKPLFPKRETPDA